MSQPPNLDSPLPRLEVRAAALSLPGWGLMRGGGRLRGEWRFDAKDTAAVFVWAVILRGLKLDLMPNIQLSSFWVRVEVGHPQSLGVTGRGLELAKEISEITGRPDRLRAATPSPLIHDLVAALRRAADEAVAREKQDER